MSIITTAYPPEHRKMLAPPRDLSLSVKPSGTERFPSIPKTYGLTDETALCSMDTVPPIQPPFDGNIPSCHLPPDSNASVSLSTQTRTTYQRLIPTLASLEQRKRFLVKLQGILDSEFPDKRIKAHLFGSTVNGLGTTSSDVDVCLVTAWQAPEPMYQGGKGVPVAPIRILAERFKRHGMLRIYTISKAKVPICKFYDPEFRLNCDINVNNTMALRNTRLVRTYVDLDPRVRPLIMLIKYWAKRRALNDAAKGCTLTSYCWVMMALHFLQTRSPPILPCLHEMYFQRLSTAPEQTSRIVIDGVDCSFFEDTEELQGFGDANKESLGELLYGFFRHYALDFDYNSSVVSVRHGRFLEKRDKGWDRDVPRMSRFLCVEEPFNPQRNLANSADLISVLGLRAEFRRALDILLDSGDLSAVCERYTPVASSALKIAAVPGYPACGKMKSDTFDHSINNNSGHARSFSASSVYYEPTATSQSGNGSSGRSHSGRSVRSFGTGMYPTQHKQQQTESGPVLWTPPPSSAYPTSQRNHYYSDSSMTSANQQYRVSANKWIKKGFYPGYYYGYPMVPPAAAPGIDQEAEEDGKLVAQDDEYTGTRATQTGADGDVEMHFPALGKVTNGSLANAVPTVENTPSLDSAESDSGLTKTPATTTVWATVDKKAYPKPSIPDAFKTVPAQTFATSSAASSKQKKHGPQHGRTQSLNVCQQSQSLLGEGEKKVKQQQRGHNIRRSNRKPTFVSLQLNGSSESKSELMSVSSESDSVSKAEAFPPRRVDSAKSVDDLAINGLTLSPSTATALDYLGAKKKGGKKTLVWSNNSHRHGRASSSTGSRMNGQMSDTSPQKTIREPVSVMKKVGSLESFKVPASVTTSRDKYVGVHVRSRSLSEGRDLAR